jgi:Uncharacterized conserved protein
MTLPLPDQDAQQASEALISHIRDEIDSAGGWIGFEHFMEMALYTPGLGYYSGGAHKFGSAGDFITAPELTPIFAQTLATQVRQILALSTPHILEVGAGSGRLVADLLLELAKHDALPESYEILDLSGELRERQQVMIAEMAPHLLSRLVWLDRLPERFDGLVLANELLDAMPVHLLRWGNEEDPETIFEHGVCWHEGAFTWSDRLAQGRVLDYARQITEKLSLPIGYLSEIGLAAMDWIASWGRILHHGALLIIDYGFPQHEFYHPQRDGGTLMCHYRHRAHTDPFFLPGLQDITAHVDFTAVIESGHLAGLDLLGYTTQASFLMNNNLADALARISEKNTKDYLLQAQAVQKLVSPAEMGELFKVMVLGKEIQEPLIGFSWMDRSVTL